VHCKSQERSESNEDRVAMVTGSNCKNGAELPDVNGNCRFVKGR